MKLKKGDEVKIVGGKDNGKTGKIETVLPKKKGVIVTGINQYKRHKKARMQREKSEIITITKPLPVSNVQLICPKCKSLTRVGYVLRGTEKKRICRKCEAEI